MKLRIDKAIYGGAGLGRIPHDPAAPNEEPARAGKAVFVPYALPGELVEAGIVEDRRGFATAELTAVLDPSPHRALPGCEYFPACGGCHYQHATAEYQTQMKVEILRDALARAHVSGLPETIAALSAEPWAYRNRIRLHIERWLGRVRLCYRRRGSHQNLPVTHCPIAAPLIERAIAAVESLECLYGLADQFEEIEFFTNGAQDALLLSLWTKQAKRIKGGKSTFRGQFLDQFCEQLKAQLPELIGAGAFQPGKGDDRLVGHWGESSLFYSVPGRTYQVSLRSFFQINRFLIPRLVELVAGAGSAGGRTGRIAWDLYAGVGLFSLALDYDSVTAVEAAPSSFADLKRNLSGAGRHAVSSTTLNFLRSEQRRPTTGKPDLIVLDPPRAGLGPEVCAHLVEAGAARIVYVSCDPSTLARDLQALLQSGYRIGTLHVVDLFPQTYHLETVAALVRS